MNSVGVVETPKGVGIGGMDEVFYRGPPAVLL